MDRLPRCLGEATESYEQPVVVVSISLRVSLCRLLKPALALTLCTRKFVRRKGKGRVSLGAKRVSLLLPATRHRGTHDAIRNPGRRDWWTR